MFLAQTVGIYEIILIIVYLGVVGYLGYLGYRRTKTATDYLVAGRQAHPFIMALSYGATFISTSAIVGFGGVAGMFGMSLLWLTFLNIFVGIFIAFVFLGGPTRRMGHRLDAHTFPELLGRRYQSKLIQILSGLIIFVFIPLYAAAVLIGGCAFIASVFNIGYDVALLVFSAIIAIYVIMGGLKGVMYTDALQGSIMFAGMLVLLVATYIMVGGVETGHSQLTELATKQPSLFKGLGFKGWTSMPEFGFGEANYDLWWIVVSTITLGVGIGVLAQPQLAVRFMTVKSKRQLNRAVLVGGLFILVMTGVAFTVGSLSNVYFMQQEEITGRILDTVECKVVLKRQRNINAKDPKNPDIKAAPAQVLEVDTDNNDIADTFLIAKGYDIVITKVDGKPKPNVVKDPATDPRRAGSGEEVLQVVPFSKLLPAAEVTEAENGMSVIKPKSNAYMRALIKREDGLFECMTSRIIPYYIGSAMPKWFGLVFLLTLLAAAMSTLSSQFHALGTSIGRDVYEQVVGAKGGTIGITRVGILLGIIIAVVISYFNQGGGFIIARATAIFFGLCASTFLPAFIGGLFFKRVTRPAALASMVVGFVVTAFWLLFVKEAEAAALGVVFAVTDMKPSILAGYPNWPVVDPIVIALPLSTFTLIIMTFITKRPSEEHLNKCFPAKAR